MPTNPMASDVHISRRLGNYSHYWTQQQSNFVADQATPMIPVEHQTDLFSKWSRGDLYRDEVQERADGTLAQEMQIRESTEPYKAKVYALRAPITDRQRVNADAELRLERSKTGALTQKHMIHREVRWATTFFGTGIWTAPGSDTVPGTKWDAAASTPIQDIRDGMDAVSITGLEPNRIVFGKDAWRAFMDNDDVLGRIEGGATPSQPALVQRSLVAAMFEVEQVMVMKGVQNTADMDPDDLNTETLARIGADDVLIYHAPTTVSMETPTAMAKFSWTGLIGAASNGVRVLRYRDTPRQTNWVETESAFDFKVTAPELGYLINDVAT